MINALASRCKLFLPALGTIALLWPLPSEAARERPWAPVTAPASIAVVARLPSGTPWHDVVVNGSGQFILQRSAPLGEPGLVRIDSFGQSHAYPSDTLAQATLDAPTALALSSGSAIWVVNSRKGAAPFVAQLDEMTGHIRARHNLPAKVLTPDSHIVALAVHEPMIYLADEGASALITFNTQKNTFRKFFAHYPALLGQKPMNIHGQVVRATNGVAEQRNISYLALENDGAWLYMQTPTGPLYKISTDVLRDPDNTPIELMESMTEWRGTPTVGGIAISPANTVFFTDRTDGRLLAFDSSRHPSILLTDARLYEAQTPFFDARSQLLYAASGQDLLQITPSRAR